MQRPRYTEPLHLRGYAIPDSGPIWASIVSADTAGDDPPRFGAVWVTARTDLRRGGFVYDLEHQAEAPQPVRLIAAIAWGLALTPSDEPAEQLLDWWWKNPPAGLTIGYRSRYVSISEVYMMLGRGDELTPPAAPAR